MDNRGSFLENDNDFSCLSKNFYCEYYDKDRLENKSAKLYLKIKNGNEEKKIEVAGDVIYNLKAKITKRNRYGEYECCTHLGSILAGKDDNQINDSYDGLFKKLNVLRYSPMNISIMPKTGGLNLIKKGIGEDRLDTFAWLLDCYYKGITAPIINAGTQNSCINNRLILRSFLDGYNGVDELFDDIYGIDKEFVCGLIESGKEAITDEEGLFNYIQLAIDFWELRMKQERIEDYLQDEEKIEYEKAIEQIREYLEGYEV